jgi:nicotinamide-nucleotide amidase
VAARAGIVVTGTEVLTGRVVDRNGPWLAEQLRVAGVDVAHIVVTGDRPDDLRAALQFVADNGVDLIITSGGLGPTADDLTAEVVADFQGRPAAVNDEMQRHIGNVVDRLSRGRGWRMEPDAVAAAVRKQALVPRGASVLMPVGTAPGLVVPASDEGPPVVVLPGPPRELQGMWPATMADPTVVAALTGRVEIRQRTMRLWGTPEHELAATLRDNAAAIAGLEITTCLRTGELEIVTRFPPSAEDSYAAFEKVIKDAYSDTLFSPDGRTVDQVVAQLLLDRKLTIATAESCTGGLLAGRLTDLAGSSAYVMGALTTYSNETKHDLAGVPTELIARVGAVSEEVALALADGARARVGTDIGVGITGVAGPGGGTPDKPVGLVYLCATDGTARVSRRLDVPGSRADVRNRSVVVALHAIRELLGG